MAQCCVQAIADLNWKYYGSGYYKRPSGDSYSAETAFIISSFDPFDDECEYLTNRSGSRSYHSWRLIVDDLGKTLTFHIAYLEARCYLGQDLTDEGLYASWERKPSPWLDAILAKVGKKMSDWV